MSRIIKYIVIVLFVSKIGCLYSKDTLSLTINISKYEEAAQNILCEQYITENANTNNLNILTKYKLEDLHALSIPIFYINNKREYFDCSSNIASIINFEQNFENQVIIIYNNYNKIVKIVIHKDSLMVKQDSMWFINKVTVKENIIKQYIKKDKKFILFTINDEISGLWSIYNNNICKVSYTLNKFKFINGTKSLLKNYPLDFIQKPFVIYNTPRFIGVKKICLKIKKKNKCKEKSNTNTYITLNVI
ncbi:MAG: hypothetical protein JXR68_09125 [Bacteroidales bacterium]|nr:hypothetical protein [Bacteroidales bacterium]